MISISMMRMNKLGIKYNFFQIFMSFKHYYKLEMLFSVPHSSFENGQTQVKEEPDWVQTQLVIELDKYLNNGRLEKIVLHLKTETESSS